MLNESCAIYLCKRWYGKAVTLEKNSLNVNLPTSFGFSFLSQLLLPTSSKPFSYFSSPLNKIMKQQQQPPPVTIGNSFKSHHHFCVMVWDSNGKTNCQLFLFLHAFLFPIHISFLKPPSSLACNEIGNDSIKKSFL